MGNLLASAASRSIIPPREIIEMCNMNHRGYFDVDAIDQDLLVNVLVMADGDSRFVLITDDLMMPVGGSLPARIEAKYGIPTDNIIMGCTHNHAMVVIPADQDLDSPDFGMGPFGKMPGAVEFTTFVHDRTMEAVDEAMATLRPAKFAGGRGFSGLSVKREWKVPGGTIQTACRNEYSDKEVNILRVDELDGSPMALFVSNCTHSDFMIWCKENYPHISGEIGGIVSANLRKMIGGNVVVGWGMGGGGDQDPYMKGAFSWPTVTAPGEYSHESGMLDGESALLLMEELAMMASLDVKRVYDGITEFATTMDLKTKVVCREIAQRKPMKNCGIPWNKDNSSIEGAPDESNKVLMDKPLHFRFQLNNLGGVCLAAWNAEPFAQIGRYVKDIVTDITGCSACLIYDLNRGHEGYLPDAAGDRYFGFGAMNTKAYSAYDTEQAFRSAYYELAEAVK